MVNTVSIDNKWSPLAEDSQVVVVRLAANLDFAPPGHIEDVTSDYSLDLLQRIAGLRRG